MENSTIASPAGSTRYKNRGSSSKIIVTAPASLTAMPHSPGKISVTPFATTTVSLVRRLSHSPECTAVTPA